MIFETYQNPTEEICPVYDPSVQASKLPDYLANIYQVNGMSLEEYLKPLSDTVEITGTQAISEPTYYDVTGMKIYKDEYGNTKIALDPNALTTPDSKATEVYDQHGHKLIIGADSDKVCYGTTSGHTLCMDKANPQEEN